MKRIGIITLNGYFNYGNRLQNYALQETLKSYGHDVETIWIKEESKKKRSFFKRIIKLIINPFRLIKSINRRLIPDKAKLERTERFKSFSNKYIKESDYFISENNLKLKKLNTFDHFVTGSDQVWNPYYIKGSSLYFLTFAPKEKRISYAASFGVSEIPKEHKVNYTKWLEDMNHISVREDDGAKIVESLTDKEVPVVLDPTLLLTKEKWLEITSPCKYKPKEDILLTYFLGDISRETKKMIAQLKKKYKLKVVNLANPKYEKHYLADPAEFLDYIYYAELFITDSFHGAVFSILFETPFVVTDRNAKIPSMNSRINTLLSTFQLESRHINRVNKEHIFDVDFSQTYKILDKEREKSFKYFNNALNTKELVLDKGFEQ